MLALITKDVRSKNSSHIGNILVNYFVNMMQVNTYLILVQCLKSRESNPKLILVLGFFLVNEFSKINIKVL